MYTPRIDHVPMAHMNAIKVTSAVISRERRQDSPYGDKFMLLATMSSDGTVVNLP